jgi:hypothetical protein
VAGIPVVGPALAPAAAASTYAAEQAYAGLAAFETGGIVPGLTGTGVPIMAHSGEAVLPQPLTAMLMDAAVQRNSPSAGVQYHSHFSPQISVLDSRGLDGFTRRAGNHLAGEMQRQARRQNRAQ